MVTGIVLVNVERPMLRGVITEVMKIKGVTEVFTVAGDKELADLKAQIQAITGELSKSGNADAAKAATDMQAKLSTML
jgi:hypothetical protein